MDDLENPWAFPWKTHAMPCFDQKSITLLSDQFSRGMATALALALVVWLR